MTNDELTIAVKELSKGLSLSAELINTLTDRIIMLEEQVKELRAGDQARNFSEQWSDTRMK